MVSALLIFSKLETYSFNLAVLKFFAGTFINPGVLSHKNSGSLENKRPILGLVDSSI
jgi:hypothetical protein